MKARPLLFKAEMIQALLREIYKPGTGKTMTRRTMKPQPQYIEHPDCAGWYWESPKKIEGFNPVESWQDSTSKEWLSEFIGDRYSPYGKQGDLIWCRETLGAERYASRYWNDIWYCADNTFFGDEIPGDWSPPSNTIKTHRETGDNIPGGSFSYYTATVPSIFMPRWASRITLLIEDVRVERLQDIREEDAKAEGVEPICYNSPFGNLDGWKDYMIPDSMPFDNDKAKASFQSLWKSINGEESWNSNPYVWVLKFRPILANVDAVIENPEKYGITTNAR